MSRLVWDQVGQKKYETGAKNCVLFPMLTGSYQKGTAWNGLTAVNESPKGAELTPLWADDSNYGNMMSAEEYGGTIEAYTYPKEFEVCDGSVEVAGGVTIGQQPRKPFGLCYVTSIGNDTEGDAYGEKIHIVYGAQASPSDKGYKTKTESPEAVTLSWEFKSTPVPVKGHKPSATMTVDSTTCDAEKFAALKDILYGTDAVGEKAVTESRLPLPDEIITLIGPVVAG